MVQRTKQDMKLEVFFSSFSLDIKTWNKSQEEANQQPRMTSLFVGNINSTRFQPSQIWTEKWWVFLPPPCMSFDWPWIYIVGFVWDGQSDNWNSQRLTPSETEVMSEPDVVEQPRSLLACSWWATNPDMFPMVSFCWIDVSCFGSLDSWSFLVFKNLPPDPLGRLRAWTCRDSWRYGCCIVPTMS